MEKLFQTERTVDDIIETLDTQNLIAIKDQLRQLIDQSEQLLWSLKKIETQTKENKKTYHKAKVISLLKKS
ncbi:hypothetical protein [Spongiimicrobium salis]|uniref:hypothetical protein n=1 Tax=Spongiimicrobium salis TaxID=1667022 RepID=UPI00374DBE14